MLRGLAVALLLTAACGSSDARVAAPGQPSAAAEPALDPGIDANRLEAQLTPYIESIGAGWGDAYRFSGFVLVAAADRPVYAEGFGFADRTLESPITADTSFRIGSVTKPFTAAAILRLQQQGKLSVSDPIRKHIPGYPAAGAGVTIHQLLTHTSGIPSYTNDPAVMQTRGQPRTVQQMLELFWDRPLEFAPGSQFRYSNSGYVILGAIIERASGQPYAEYMREHVFAPAGLNRTVVGDAEGMTERALGYAPDGQALAEASAIDMSVPYAAGAIRSTANDLVRWHRALAGDDLLSEASRQAMYTPDKEAYAYGWVVTEHDGHRFIGHGGGIDGFATSYVRVMDLDMVVVVLANNPAVDTEAIADAAVRAALGQPVEPVQEAPPLPHDPRLAARVAGRYEITTASQQALAAAGLPAEVIQTVLHIDVIESDGGLTFDPAGQPPLPMARTGEAKFLVRAAEVQLQFELPAKDAVATTLRVTQGPLTIDYTRVGDVP